MPFPISQAIEVRPFKATRLPDGRKRIERFVSWKQNSELPVQMGWEYGHADIFSGAPTGWTGLFLVKAETDYSIANNGSGNDPVIILTFEQISATDNVLTQIGDTTFNQTQTGLQQTVIDYAQFDTAAYTAGIPGTTTAPGDATSYLFSEELVNDGSVRRIKRTFSKAGLVEQRDESKNNGALLIRTLVNFKTVPSTPSGYTLIASPVQAPGGFPIYTYTYAKGTGEISRSLDLGSNGVTVDGSIGTSRLSIEYLTVPGASEPSWTGTSGYIQVTLNHAERDGHMIWSTVFAKGAGLVQQNIRTRQDGLREVTNIAFGTRSAPVGIVIQDDYREESGFHVYTVTSMQTASGSGTVTGASVSFERYVPFTYPGRAKAWIEVVTPKSFLDVFLSPSVQTLVKATVTVSYQTTNTLGTISNFWNPSEAATMRATWVGAYGVSASRNQALPGYRTVSSTPVTLTGTGSLEAIFGYSLYNGEDGTITCTGGPADPGGSTWTLEASLEPCFTSSTGTQYYRRTEVVAAIPSQSALPV